MSRFTLSLLIVSALLFSFMPAPAQDADAPLSTCTLPADLVPGGSEYRIEVDDDAQPLRVYRLYVPEGLEPGAPLVLSFHGFTSNATQQEQFSLWNDVADAEGIVVAYPQGSGFPSRWNSGLNPFAPRENANDVIFVETLIDHLTATLCIDTARVYANGLSNGGGMSNRLACELSGRVAAIGGVAGAYAPLPKGCEPTRPVPVIAFHGDADSIVPYEGIGDPDDPTSLAGIEDWVVGWAARNGCDLTPDALEPIGNDVTGITYGGCDADAEVRLYTVAGGGHTWPGGGFQPAFIVGATTQSINASATMWDFFTRYRLPDSTESD